MAGPSLSPLRIEYQRPDGSYADGALTVEDLPRLVRALDGGTLSLNSGAVELLLVSGEAPRCMVSYLKLDEDGELEECWDLVGDASASREVEVELMFGGQNAEWPRRLIVGIDEALSACVEFAETRRRPQGDWVAQSSSEWPGG